MAILAFKADTEVGLVGVRPRILYLDTNDAIATVATAGYLNNIINEGNMQVSVGDMVLAMVIDAGVQKPAWLSLSKVGSDWKLDNPITA